MPPPAEVALGATDEPSVQLKRKGDSDVNTPRPRIAIGGLPSMSVSELIALPPALRTSGAREVLATPSEPAIAVPQIAQSSFPAAVRSPCTGGVAEFAALYVS